MLRQIIAWLHGSPAAPAHSEAIRQIKLQAARDQEEMREHHRRRIAELKADPDPARRKYAKLVERGGQWSDAQIAYNDDPERTGTCPHLAPLELAMRRAGIRTHLRIFSWKDDVTRLLQVRADCCVNAAALNLAPPVSYQEGYQPERHPEDNPWAKLSCDECRSSIELTHSEWSRGTLPWFPSRP
jgi:hypothetical protein